MRPHVVYIRSADGTRIAAARYGEGPGVPLVSMRPPQFSHLEREWDAGWSHHEYEAFTTSREVIRYDPRGTGLSDRGVREQGLDAHIADLEAVLDALSLRRVAVDAISSSALTAVIFAARHPERVAGLSLQNVFRRGRDWWDLAPRRALLALAAIDWTLATETWAWITFASPDSTAIRKLGEHIRACIDPADFVRMAWGEREVDMTEALHRVAAPTLILSHTHFARMVPAEWVRGVAREIRGAELVSISTVRERVDAIAAFLARLDRLSAEPDSLPPPASVLSRREVEVLRLVANGMSNREIAGEFLLSARTVDAHVASILRKTGLRSRVEAAGYAIRHGLSDANGAASQGRSA